MIDIPEHIYPKAPNGNAAKSKIQPVKPSIRLDRSGRRGKVVTLIGALPRNEAYLKDLAKELKVKTGSGGTFYLTEDGGAVELQGDHKKAVMEFFRNIG